MEFRIYLCNKLIQYKASTQGNKYIRQYSAAIIFKYLAREKIHASCSLEEVACFSCKFVAFVLMISEVGVLLIV